MKEQVMIYEIKSSAASNAVELFKKDQNYFYWNDKTFKNLSINDYVFVINRTSKWVLLTQLNKVNINTEENELGTRFTDLGENFTVSGKWNKFVRLKILLKEDISPQWQWKSLGNSETTYLNGPKIDKLNKNRITNITQLKELSSNKEFLTVLDNCLSNFTNSIQMISAQKKDIEESDKSILNEMESLLNAIKTKPFILLAGLSGTGKSRLVRTLAYKSCNNETLRSDPKKPGNFEIIPVRPNWHDSSELIGYISRIDGEKYIITSFLKFIAKAWKNLDIPFFLCLDEMNLAPVEQYFAEYLSIIETRQVQNGKIVTDYLISKASIDNNKDKANNNNESLYKKLLADLGLPNNEEFAEGISIPQNLVVIGTVNMDETTHSFSRKVLDRAMTFEMNHVDLNTGLELNTNDWSYPVEYITSEEVIGKYTSGAEVVKDFKDKQDVIDFLVSINKELEGTPFKIAYRVRDEFLVYCHYASLKQKDSEWMTKALDEMTFMKILTRIEGDEAKTGIVLKNLLGFLSKYKSSDTKLKEMQERLERTGYTSFWT